MTSDYRRTDLASECCSYGDVSGDTMQGISYTQEHTDGFDISRLEIQSANASRMMKKPCGRYVTIDIGKVWTLDTDRLEACTKLLAHELSDMLEHACGKKTHESVLVAGLGNRYITSDALGHETLKSIVVTRHLKSQNKRLYKLLGERSVAAIAPGVVGQTGLETLELIRAAADDADADAVIAIDALAARDLSHLATTVQITDTGIAPGSGIGNKRLAIDRSSLGRPVVALGVPTVVGSSTLVYSALEQAGIEDITPQLRHVLENGRDFFVTPKESDIINTEASRLLAEAINLALS